MKKQFLYLFTALMIYASLNTFAQANQDFTLVNKTGVTIYKFFVAPVSDSKSWGPNLLGDTPLENGESIEISFDKSSFPDDCLWDAKVLDEAGTSLSWFDIDLCKYYEITLKFNFDTQKGSASFK